MFKPSSLVGCGGKFSYDERGISFNTGGGPEMQEGYFWTNLGEGWGVSLSHPSWKCGYPNENSSNNTTYYCSSCQIKAGLIW